MRRRSDRRSCADTGQATACASPGRRCRRTGRDRTWEATACRTFMAERWVAGYVNEGAIGRQTITTAYCCDADRSSVLAHDPHARPQLSRIPTRHDEERARVNTAAPLHERVRSVTERIRLRSADARGDYLERAERSRRSQTSRAGLSCTNLAHGFAAMDAPDKEKLRAPRWPNLAIVSSYNDMLSAHRPFERFPELIKLAAREAGAVAQFAGGVPAMCDGVTQGQPGMELSLFSRDVIAMSTAVALAHDMFDSALYLGISDKIVPGLLMGALTFGHLPAIFVPGGPMSSGMPNKEKARVRQLFAEGKAGRDALLESESQSYHSQ